METIGMMKMASGDDFPLWQGAGTGSRLVFRGYRGLRRRNFWSRVISGGFWIYRIFGRRFHAKMGHEETTRHQPKLEGAGAAWWVVPTSWLFWPSNKASSASFVPKNRQKVSLHLENFDFCTKNNTTVVLLKTASVRISSMQIIPKPYKFVVNMAWILHKL